MVLRDPVCSISHMFFAFWAIFASLMMIRLAPASRKFAVAIFGGSMVLLYAASGVFHGVPYTLAEQPDEFRFFQRIDQSAIFLLIAGTNTPLMVVLLGGRWRRMCLLGMWSLAWIGFACFWLFPKPPHSVIVLLCLVMGWLGVVPIIQYYRALGWRAMNWAMLGSALYTFGAVCELTEWPLISATPIRVGSHEIFHLLCIAASASFFVFILRHVIHFDSVAFAHRKILADKFISGEWGVELKGYEEARAADAKRI